MFSRGMERDQWHEVDWSSNYCFLQFPVVVTWRWSVKIFVLKDFGKLPRKFLLKQIPTKFTNISRTTVSQSTRDRLFVSFLIPTKLTSPRLTSPQYFLKRSTIKNFCRSHDKPYIYYNYSFVSVQIFKKNAFCFS